MRIIVLISAVGVLVLSTSIGYRVFIAESWQATTKERIGVFETMSAAAYQNPQNRPAPSPIAVLEAGENVSVVRDAYGKDYWACYIRTQEQIRGWILCTSLVRESS